MGGTWRGIAAGNAVRREAVTAEWDPEVELMEEVDVKMGALVGLAVGWTLMLGNWEWVGVLVVSMSSHNLDLYIDRLSTASTGFCSIIPVEARIGSWSWAKTQ